MVEKPVVDCFICRKHQGEILVPGGAVYEDDLVYASHASIADEEESTYLGAFLVEPKRHAPGIGDLTGPEAIKELIKQAGDDIAGEPTKTPKGC